MNFRLSVDKINIALLYKQINRHMDRYVYHQFIINLSFVMYLTHVIRYMNKNSNMQKIIIYIKVLVIHYQFNGAIFFGFAPALSSASH